MRTYDKYDAQEINASQWQLDLLQLNPDYVSWGPHEDYMWKDGQGWDSSKYFNSWKDFGPWQLNDLNECVNFYFEVTRESHECEHCTGIGLNQETKKLSDEWYSSNNTRYVSLGNCRRYNDNAWKYHLTEVEIEALVEGGRLTDLMKNGNSWYYKKDENWYLREWSEGKGWSEGVQCEKPIIPTPEVVNEWAKKGIGHDSINQWICVKSRAKHLGVYGHCEHCEGRGHIFDADCASINLILWMLHPRKGCSRGVEIKNIQQEELPEIFAFLKQARDRNANRFSKII